MKIVTLKDDIDFPIIDFIIKEHKLSASIRIIAAKIAKYFGDDVQIVITLESMYVTEPQIWLEINSKYSVVESLALQNQFCREWWLKHFNKYDRLHVTVSFYKESKFVDFIL